MSALFSVNPLCHPVVQAASGLMGVEQSNYPLFPDSCPHPEEIRRKSVILFKNRGKLLFREELMFKR